MSAHGPGEDAGGVPDNQEIGAVASGLRAVKVNQRYRGVIGVGVVVNDGVAGSDRAARGSPARVVGVELGAVGGDGGDGDVGECDAASGVTVAVSHLSFGDAGQRGGRGIEGGSGVEGHLVGVAYGVRAISEPLGRVIEQGDRYGHEVRPSLALVYQ